MIPRLAVIIVAFAITAEAGAQPAPTRLTLVREMVIDGEAEALNSFWTIAVAADGRVIVPQAREGQFRVYDARGRRVGTFGRTGRGPGEFDQSVSSFGWHGDTIWVHDFNQRRITFVSPRLTLIRTQAWSEFPKNVPAADPRAGPVFLRFSRLYRDGSQLGQMPFGPPDAESGFRTDLRFVIVDAGGNITRHIAHVPPTTGRVSLPEMRGRAVDVPLAAQPAMSVSTDGERIGFAIAQPPSNSRGSYVVTVIGRGGDTVFSTSYPYIPERIPAAAKADALEQMDRRLRRTPAEGPDAMRLPVDQIMARVRPLIPDTYQPLREMRFGEDDTIWLQLNDMTALPRYRMLDGKGAVVGDVVLPERSMFGAATRTQLWLIEMNEDGVPSLVRYRLTTGSS